MSKYELAISPDYVPNWTVVDAVRELFQNALDESTTIQDNAWFIDYLEDANTLIVGNRKSVLNIQSLLLGSTTKADDKGTIGKFGEGYKIASLVLLREGKELTFYNYGAHEIWNPRLVNSKRYGTKILTFFIEKKPFWSTPPDSNLTIAIKGITPDEYQDIIESNLHLQLPTACIETNKGRILLDEKYKGKIYVNGLFVCNYSEYHLGYDFKPAYIKLDRDRKLVSDFELKWLASSIWSEVSEEYSKMIVQLSIQGAVDVQLVSSHLRTKTVENSAYESFRNTYGTRAVPVSSQRDADRVTSAYKAVIVPDTYRELIVQSDDYEEPEEVEPSIKERLSEWYSNLTTELTDEEKQQFESILEDMEE